MSVTTRKEGNNYRVFVNGQPTHLRIEKDESVWCIVRTNTGGEWGVLLTATRTKGGAIALIEGIVRSLPSAPGN